MNFSKKNSKEKSKMSTIMIMPVFNEKKRIIEVIKGFQQKVVDCLFIVNDGSSDNTPKVIRNAILKYLRKSKTKVIFHNNKVRKGVGYSIQLGLRYALKHNYQIIGNMPGNGKDKPKDILKLIKPILNNEADYVTASRFHKKAKIYHMPMARKLLIKLYTIIFKIIFPKYKGTDVTNGFRAYKIEIIKHRNINPFQSWLNKYELEYYILYKALENNFRFKEVPISKYYPKTKRNYSKITPFLDWFNILKPLVFLRLGIKK